MVNTSPDIVKISLTIAFAPPYYAHLSPLIFVIQKLLRITKYLNISESMQIYPIISCLQSCSILYLPSIQSMGVALVTKHRQLCISHSYNIKRRYNRKNLACQNQLNPTDCMYRLIYNPITYLAIIRHTFFVSLNCLLFIKHIKMLLKLPDRTKLGIL